MKEFIKIKYHEILLKRKLLNNFNICQNSISSRFKFKNYKEYLYYQNKVGLSFEHEQRTWSDGQRKCIGDKFKNVDTKSDILDVCCGDGVGLQKLKELGFHKVTGIDISDDKILRANKVGFEVHKEDICLGIKNLEKKFDFIYSSHTIEHVLDPFYTLEKLLAYLKDDGVFHLILPYPDLGAVDASNEIRSKIHCGAIPLLLHINDDGISLKRKIQEKLNVRVTNCALFNYREPEIHLSFQKFM